MSLAGGAGRAREALLKPAKAVKARILGLRCLHRNVDGSSAWYLWRRRDGYAYYRCGRCGLTSTVPVG